MNRIQHGFENIRFTQEEKAGLAARLRQAAEQKEDVMTNETKKKVRKLSRGAVIGIAAALTLTAGAVAAAVSPTLRSYFDTRSPEDQKALEQGIYRLDRSLTHNGWTVALDECVGDDYQAFIWVDVTAPEGMRLKAPEDGTFVSGYSLERKEHTGYMSRNLEALADENDQDNKISFCLEATSLSDEGLRGDTVDITLEPIVDTWITGFGTEAAQTHEGGPLTEAIRGHSWVFEDVELSYPDQSVRLEPEIEVPYLGGTATLAYVEVSPLTTTVRLEGGTCYLHHAQDTYGVIPDEDDAEIKSGDFTIQAGGTDISQYVDCWGKELPLELHMKDGTVLPCKENVGGTHCDDGGHSGLTPEETFVEKRVLYAESHSNVIPPRAIDPAQVDYVTVCGVDIPVNPGS